MRIEAVVRGRLTLKRVHPERVWENHPGGLQEKRPKRANQAAESIPEVWKGRLEFSCCEYASRPQIFREIDSLFCYQADAYDL